MRAAVWDRVVLGCLLGALGCAPITDGGTSSSALAAEAAALGQPALFVEAEGAPAPTQAALEPSCTPSLAALPSELFDHRVSLSLPAGLDARALEAGGGVTRWRPRASDCRPELTTSTAEVAVLTYRERTTSPTPLAEWHHRLCETLHFPATREIELVAGDLDGDDATMVLAFPDDPVWDDTRVYLRVVLRDGRVVALAYMGDAASWDALAPSFAASARSLVLRS